MTYMRTLYPDDWKNFLERLGPRLKGIDPASISEEDFCTGGSLEDLQMDVQLWASYRGQLLARTVRGAAPGLTSGYSRSQICAVDIAQRRSWCAPLASVELVACQHADVCG